MHVDLKLGQIITGEAHRDAIHVAVAPVVAAAELEPGQEIGFISAGSDEVAADGELIGVVDPFLKAAVRKGQRFWAFLYPNTVVGMRHHWQHPAFDPVEPPKFMPSESERWLREFAEKVGRGYEDLLELGGELARDHSAYVGDDDDQDTFNDHKKDFLWHVGNVIGQRIDPEDAYFSCAC